MAESYTKKRVKFLAKNEQIEFFKLLKEEPRLATEAIAVIGKVGVRQVSDWKNGKSTIPLHVFDTLLKISKIPRPNNIQILDQYSHIPSAAKKAYLATIKKYGKIPKNEELRKENWEKWWEKTGQFQKRKIFEPKKIRIPRKSVELAELFGILIGDGGISKYQVRVSLNCETDKKYSTFVIKLMYKLFNIKPKKYPIKNTKALDVCISSTLLVDFLVANGLKLGNKLKQNLSIPAWIMASPKYTMACIRGMVDTDGSVVREVHTIKGKKYLYHRLNFTSASPLLVEQTIQSLQNFNFHPKLRRGGRSVQLENKEEICNYFNTVGTSNPKHTLRRSGSRGLRHRS